MVPNGKIRPCGFQTLTPKALQSIPLRISKMTLVFLLSERRQMFNNNNIAWLTLQPVPDHVTWPWTADCIIQQQRLPGQGAACSLRGEVWGGAGAKRRDSVMWGPHILPRGLPSAAKPVSCSALSPACPAKGGHRRKESLGGRKGSGEMGTSSASHDP